ncbi:hypothetical protein DUI87_08198 [Hirundo rustica rustica]|uniref:ribonuclease H n=1 Tax=Hirundo rustica rustica TaxID=333673 RepID=A0A3M0KTI9_HIRRU|nr:hypothetical protein DUI87_08198 [Hirundo rustica rustica]
MHQPSPVPSVSPVVYKGSRGGHNVRAVHHPFSQATIRDLCKAHRDYGRDSPYFRGLLHSNLEAAVVIPADLGQLFSCLLDSTEFKQWEAAWRQLLREALPSLLTDPETAIDENGNALTLEQLMGEGRWTDPTDQASSIPTKALQTIREHAVTAFFSMVPDGPIIPYYKIVQGTKEAFTRFVERLTRAIEVQVAEVAVREGILREMVFTNVNNLCRTAILSLPLDPPPTIQDMLRVCQLKVPYMQGNDWDAKSTTSRVAAISGTQQEHIRRPDLMAQWGVKIDIPDPSVDISTATIEERPTKKLNWLTDNPVWVEQWPLSKQKLKALEELVEEQLRKGHIVETDSPWNSPVFVIQKLGKDKWRLLQDLCQINNVIEDIGSLQLGMPSPTMLPKNWKLAIIDIKDCFFQIPLHPDDAPRFAFSVPTINQEAPRKRYHWRVLPQGMKNGPVICQWYVASLLSPVRAAAGQAIIHHSMDDVLVCALTDDVLTHALDLTINALIAAGFELQEEKFQRMPPWKYLGLEMGKRTIVPQKLAIKTKWKYIPKKDRDGKDPLSIIEWVFLSHQRSKRMTRPQELVAELIRKARFRIRELAGCDFVCIHIPIRAVFASAHTGEKAGDVIKHLILASSFLGIPKELKTDNGPAYKSRELCSFLQQWGVEHKTGIPHSPTGQAMVERTHGTIKRVLHQQQRVLKVETPAVRLARALFTINFLNCSFEGLNPPIIRHFGASSLFSIRERPPVMVRDPESGRTEGPHDLVTWGRGYACKSTPTGPRWIPSNLLKRILYNLISATAHSPSVNHIIVPAEESSEEEGLKLEEVLEEAPEDDREDPDEEQHGLGYPTQHH